MIIVPCVLFSWRTSYTDPTAAALDSDSTGGEGEIFGRLCGEVIIVSIHSCLLQLASVVWNDLVKLKNIDTPAALWINDFYEGIYFRSCCWNLLITDN